jgi:hypothetical protein
MTDLWLAMIAVGIICVAVGVGAAMNAPQGRQAQMLWIAVATFGMFAFLLYAAGRLYWARLVPDSAVIVWSNWTPILAALAAGICFRLADTPRWRRISMTLSLAGVSLAAILWPFLGIALRPQPSGGNAWNGPVAMQTSWATCSPAAAATFLNAGGMQVSEAEMIPRCLTDASGTPTLGLYRGVKLVANQYDRDIHVLSMSLEELIASDKWPVLLLVELPRGAEDPRYEKEWGWIPGLGHSVVALSRDRKNGIVIADPSIGLEIWSRDDMQVLWHGDAIAFDDN